jgi:hypothetical protein
VVARVARAFGVQLPVRRIFEAPTVAAMARELERLPKTGTTALERLTPRDDQTRHPLSFNQERMLYAQRNAPDAPDLVPVSFALDGPLDPVAFQRALTEVVRRHEILRARFTVGESFDESIAEATAPLSTLDLRDHADWQERVQKLALEQATQRVDMLRDPLFRVWLVRVSDQRHLFLGFVHHAIWDGMSVDVLLTELATLHDAFRRGAPSPLEELRCQYADFAAWQRAFYQRPEGRAQIAWWEKQLGNAVGPQLPTDRPREAVEAQRRTTPSHPFPRGGEYLHAPPGLMASLRERARRQQSTPYEVLMTAFLAWLSGRSGATDLTLCTQQMNRHVAGTEKLIGPFAQALVLRLDTGGDPSFAELLERLRRVLLDARAHADVAGPFLGLHRFRVNFNFFPTLPQLEGGADKLAIRPWQPVDVGRTIWYDLTLHSTTVDGELQALLWFNRALWEPETARRWVAEYGAILGEVARDPTIRLSALVRPR